MKDASEDEQEEDFMVSNSAYPRNMANLQSERAEQLRKMMEDEGRKISARRVGDPVTNRIHRRNDGRYRE